MLVGYAPKKKNKQEKRVGEETTEETSEKSEGLEDKCQGAYKSGGILAAKAKNIIVSVIIRVQQTYI